MNKLMILICSLCISTPLVAIEWEQLTSEQQQTLQSVKSQWSQMSTHKQEKLIAGANRWLVLNDKQRVEYKQRFDYWAALSTDNQDLVLAHWHQFKQMSPYRQNRMRRAFKAYRDKPMMAQSRLRDQFEQLSPNERSSIRENMRIESIGKVGRTALGKSTTGKTAVGKSATGKAAVGKVKKDN